MTTRLLLDKELRQHRAAFILLAILLFVGYFAILITNAMQSDTAAAQEQLRSFIMFFAPLASLLLGERLVSKEYSAKTQIFLEGLPVTRLRMVTVKFFLGLGLLLIMILAGAAITFFFAFVRQQMDLKFAAIVLSRIIFFCLAIYTFFFATSFLGRYRLPLYLFVAFGAFFIEDMTTIELGRFGPLALVDETFAFERHHAPINHLLGSLLLSLCFSAVALVLALLREGEIAAMVAEKMSHREKVFIAILMLAFLLVVSYADEKKAKPPFDLATDISLAENGVAVKIMPIDPSSAEKSQVLCRDLLAELSAAKTWLDLAALPTLNIIERQDLDPDQHEQGALEKSEGLLYRTNFNHRNWDRHQFIQTVLHEVLDEYSGHRAAMFERNHWILDGFALYWSTRQQDSLSAKLWLRALVGVRDETELPDLQKWLPVSEKIGDDIAAAVAWSALKTLEASQGENALRRFVQRTLAEKQPKDFRVLWQGRRAHSDKALQEIFGLTFAEFRQRWAEKLRAEKLLRSQTLQTIPRLRLQLSQTALSEKTRKLEYRVSLDDTASRPEIWTRFLYGKLKNLAMWKARQELQRDVRQHGLTPAVELPETYDLGARLYCSVETYIEALGCRLSSGWQIFEVK